MVGASISGITFVSVPGMVLKGDMTYLQMCLGFIPGYFAVAFLLLPIYYKLNLTTIYGYLRQRLGRRSYKTGAAFFIASKLVGAAVRFYVVCFILQRFVLDAWHVPFACTVVVMVALIWLYTRRAGVKTLVWSDTFQTTCMLAALVLIIVAAMGSLNLDFHDVVAKVTADPHSRVFVFDDWASRQNFWKQFLSGIFVVIVMTGLDQDMMQKNMTCKTLREAQKDMCLYGFAFVPVNLLFLVLGILLMWLASAHFSQGRRPQILSHHEQLPHQLAKGPRRFVRGGAVFLFQCRQRADGTYHERLRRLLRACRRRAVAQACAHGRGRPLHGLHTRVSCRQLHECHRCHLHSLWIYLWPAAWPFLLRIAHSQKRQ